MSQIQAAPPPPPYSLLSTGWLGCRLGFRGTCLQDTRLPLKMGSTPLDPYGLSMREGCFLKYINKEKKAFNEKEVCVWGGGGCLDIVNTDDTTKCVPFQTRLPPASGWGREEGGSTVKSNQSLFPPLPEGSYPCSQPPPRK